MRWREETERAAEHLGYKVVETDGSDDWEGWGVHLLQSHHGSWAVLSWSYGSCSGCDSYEGQLDNGDSPEDCARVFYENIEHCMSEEEARTLFLDRKGW